MPRISTFLVLSALAAPLAACGGDPVARQALVDTRFDPVRADNVLAVQFQGGVQMDPLQRQALRATVEQGRRATRDEFVVVTDGSGGYVQQSRVAAIRRVLDEAGARWVSSSVEPGMATGPDTVLIVRSEYRLGTHNCPNFGSGTQANPNEAASLNFGCASAWNDGQMLARPRDAAIGRDPGPADGTVIAAAVQRYREGRVKELIINGTTMGIVGNSGTGPGSSSSGSSTTTLGAQ